MFAWFCIGYTTHKEVSSLWALQNVGQTCPLNIKRYWSQNHGNNLPHWKWRFNCVQHITFSFLMHCKSSELGDPRTFRMWFSWSKSMTVQESCSQLHMIIHLILMQIGKWKLTCVQGEEIKIVTDFTLVYS